MPGHDQRRKDHVFRLYRLPLVKMHTLFWIGRRNNTHVRRRIFQPIKKMGAFLPGQGDIQTEFPRSSRLEDCKECWIGHACDRQQGPCCLHWVYSLVVLIAVVVVVVAIAVII
jgi:hypothetical protein